MSGIEDSTAGAIPIAKLQGYNWCQQQLRIYLWNLE